MWAHFIPLDLFLLRVSYKSKVPFTTLCYHHHHTTYAAEQIKAMNLSYFSLENLLLPFTPSFNQSTTKTLLFHGRDPSKVIRKEDPCQKSKRTTKKSQFLILFSLELVDSLVFIQFPLLYLFSVCLPHKSYGV